MPFSSPPVAIVTGAASGLGWALSWALAKKGYAVALVDINQELLQARMKQLNEPINTLALTVDITRSDELKNMVEQVINHFGHLDCLVNNAGITHRSMAQYTQPAVLRKVMDVDYMAPVELALLCIPYLKKSGGNIVNISSMAGWMPVFGRAGYCAAKAALHQFFETLRCEIAVDNVNVLMVYPSFLDTPIETNALGMDGGIAPQPRTTFGRVRDPRWMARVIVSALGRRQERLFPDRLTWLASLFYKLAPRFYLSRMRKKFAAEFEHEQ